MSSPSNPSITKPGHVHLLKKCLRSTSWDLSWKEERIEVSANTESPQWEATVIVDGHPWGSGSGPKLKVARDRAARHSTGSPDRAKDNQAAP